MPTVTFDGPAISDIDIKRTLAREVTVAAAKAYGFPEDKIIVVIKENRPENVSVGGILVADR
ncbi:MAG: tautomerase family protein [Desulfuromonadales bacterium]|nr:tautomerase family protein [Desulfuromonadales bacterium]MBN2793337.1 tautomerase family protein [Desulfuromonadales bacterium]